MKKIISLLQKEFPNSIIVPYKNNIYVVSLWEIRNCGNYFDVFFSPLVVKVVERKYFEKINWDDLDEARVAATFIRNYVHLPPFRPGIKKMIAVKVGTKIHFFDYE